MYGIELADVWMLGWGGWLFYWRELLTLMSHQIRTMLFMIVHLHIVVGVIYYRWGIGSRKGVSWRIVNARGHGGYGLHVCFRV